ncbi:4Fe-4S binding protein [bacterium]|nr:4Fe-4S binding protein [bacterium]
MAAKVDEEQCTGCETCVEECPNEAITLVNGIARVNAEVCTDCGICVDACPVEAISLE